LLAYIAQLNNILPPFHHDFWAFHREIYALFRKPENWDGFEKHLLDTLNKTVWHPANYPPEFTDFLMYRSPFIIKLLENSPTILTDIAVLTEHGFTESEIWFALHNCIYWGYEHENTSSFSKYIVNNAEKYLALTNCSVSSSDCFFERLIANKPELIDKYIRKFIRGMYKGKNYLAQLTPVKKAYLSTHASKYEDNLVSLLSLNDEGDDFQTRFTWMLFIRANYPSKYADKIETYAQQLIQLVLSDYYDVSISVFDEFLDILLMFHSPEKAFAISGNYLSKSKGKERYMIILWLKRLKKCDIPLI
jgi:hypothetical protein